MSVFTSFFSQARLSWPGVFLTWPLWFLQVSNAQELPPVELAHDSAEVSPDLDAEVDRVTALIAAQPDSMVIVRGPIDRRPTARIFEVLARVHVLSAYRELVRRGVQPGRIAIATSGVAGTNPAGNAVTMEVVPIGTTTDRPSPVPNPFGRQGDDVTFLFPSDETALPGEEAVRVDVLAAKLLATPRADVRVIGHADINGDSFYNQKVATARALAVFERLTRAGLAGEAIRVESRGNDDAAYRDPHDNTKWFLDRRVSVIFGEEIVVEEPPAQIEPIPDAPALAEVTEATRPLTFWTMLGSARPLGPLAIDLDTAPWLSLGVEFRPAAAIESLIFGVAASHTRISTDRSGQTNRLTMTSLNVSSGWRLPIAKDIHLAPEAQFGVNVWSAAGEKDDLMQRENGIDIESAIGGGIGYRLTDLWSGLLRVTWHRVGGGFGGDSYATLGLGFGYALVQGH